MTDPTTALGFAPAPSGTAWRDAHAALVRRTVGKSYRLAAGLADELFRLSQILPSSLGTEVRRMADEARATSERLRESAGTMDLSLDEIPELKWRARR